ncbi:hypothetical protein [Pseudomonas sp. NFR16]|uniref:hypothetical protein n=1 Tax=Pseudomonas sp. NFR16 TaxID=1566248 RepID=UPI0008CFC545|nr:hypothetical protein [Pseudomonas sp. NFR16]SEI56442.1 hypothetical protein SAMN03159495_0847 [Pseudomonas sp. NFR16]
MDAAYVEFDKLVRGWQWNAGAPARDAQIYKLMEPEEAVSVQSNRRRENNKGG